MKVAVIFHRFGPYHCARLEAAADRCEVVGIELGAETSEYSWSKIRETGSFERITLFPESDSRSRPLPELTSAMRKALSRSHPDVVAIPGWSEKGALVALRWCLDNRVPAVLMSETTAEDEARVWWKESVKRRIVGLCATALVGGERHKTYLSDLGMPGDRIFMGYDAVDNGFFAQGAKEAESRKEKVESGLPGNYFLASARFIPKKNLEMLIRAYGEYRNKVQRLKAKGEVWSLVILGDGPLKADLRSLISDLGLNDFVVMPGFKQYEELPAYYAFANAFIHASRVEQWGLVVNEAMASGLPVIVSNRCGCAPELVQDGFNGFSFDPDNKEQLTDLFVEMAALSNDRRREMGEASRGIVANFGPDRFGDGLIGAAEKALEIGPKGPTIFQRLILNAWLAR